MSTKNGAPGEIRTPDLLVRSHRLTMRQRVVLVVTERHLGLYSLIPWRCASSAALMKPKKQTL